MDNHPSRINPQALRYLKMHNISVITFPPHCTHLLQPFDVAVARSFKSLMQKIQLPKKAIDYLNSLPTKISKARYKLLYLITNAWNSVSKDTLKEGFMKPGFIDPYDPHKAINDEKCNKVILPIPERRNYINNYGCECITNENIILQMYNKLEKTNFTSINELPKIEYTDNIF
ncbi:hypothetical protein M9Y10_009735 [Tritrichomonas musculus]|uniref:DDE-1 domain-containing protein n=1 Tax=Tritrichomonas musculus TaxID=1915356 RepID=A0ABR2IPE7_9EUKA